MAGLDKLKRLADPQWKQELKRQANSQWKQELSPRADDGICGVLKRQRREVRRSLGMLAQGLADPRRRSVRHQELVARHAVYASMLSAGTVLCSEVGKKSCRDGNQLPEEGSPALSPITAIAASPLQPDASSSLPTD
ncbi:hypothetical protein CRENBAI_004044 [Crenichthys baileyi]|uniref:Uncharacterized protein n=1 Tax=Crenichthys baileyi TaxID=28760 RepID=A0AAV9SPD3_9TELE